LSYFSAHLLAPLWQKLVQIWQEILAMDLIYKMEEMNNGVVEMEGETIQRIFGSGHDAGELPQDHRQ
jgi:hypothetical protein